MPVQVTIPIRLRVDPEALTERQADVEEALTAAVGRALANSREKVLEPRGGYVGVRVHPPEFTWLGDGLSDSLNHAQRTLENQITTLLPELVNSLGIYDFARAADEVESPLSAAVAEPVDRQRSYHLLRHYKIPSYNQQGSETAVEYEVGTAEEGLPAGYLPIPEWSEYSLAALLDDPDFRSFLYWQAVDQYGEQTAGEWFGLIWSTGNEFAVYFVSRHDPEHGEHYWFTIPLDNFRTYVFRGIDADPLFDAVPELPLPQITIIRSHGPYQASQRRDVVRQFMQAAIRAELLKKVTRPEVMLEAQFLAAIDSAVERELERRSLALPSTEFVLLEVKIGETTIFIPIPPEHRWAGEVSLLPIAVIIPTQVGDEEGEGDASGTGAGAGAGAGDQEKPSGRGGEGSGTGTGDEEPADSRGFVYTAEADAEAGGQFFPTARGARGTLICEPFLGEPSIAEVGSDGAELKRLMDEIAYKLQISPCEFTGQFCLNAAAALGSRALAIGSYAVNETGFTRQVEVNTGNLGTLQFVPDASPAIQLMRHLAGVTPLISTLSQRLYEIYGKSEHRHKISGFRQNQPIGWHLDFGKELTPLMEEAVGYMFAMTCRVLLLQLLRVSRTSIQNRINNFATYAPLFEQLVLTQLADVNELIRLRDQLQEHQRLAQVRDALRTADAAVPGGLAIVPGADWLEATRLLTEALTAQPSQTQADSTPQTEGQIIQQGGISRIRDAHGTLWSLSDLEAAIPTRRGTAEDIDPLVKQITNLPDIMARFRVDQTAIRRELYRLLYEMLDNNQQITNQVNDSWQYAFNASKIHEDLPAATISGTSFALQGIHLQAHEQIGEFFQGSPYYTAGINALFGARLGAESLTAFFEFTGLVLLAVICPPAAVAAGIGLAVKQYAHALEMETLYGALIDPELVISRAEVEAELFAAKLGLALAFIPEAGSVLRVGRYGIRAVSRAGLAGGTRLVGRYVARRITREMVEALSRNLVLAFAQEVVTNVVMDRIIGTVMEPFIQQVEREASITGPVGGSQGAEMVRRMLESERQVAAGQSNPDRQGTVRERRE